MIFLYGYACISVGAICGYILCGFLTTHKHEEQCEDCYAKRMLEEEGIRQAREERWKREEINCDGVEV